MVNAVGIDARGEHTIARQHDWSDMKRNRGSPDRFEDPARVADAMIARVGKNIVLALTLAPGGAARA